MLLCDFCLQPAQLVRDYHPDAKLIAHLPDNVVFIDDGDWGACAECTALIDARRFHDLTERLVSGMIQSGMVGGTKLECDAARGRALMCLQYVLGVSVA
jgi:hypothetical protein